MEKVHFVVRNVKTTLRNVGLDISEADCGMTYNLLTARCTKLGRKCDVNYMNAMQRITREA